MTDELHSDEPKADPILPTNEETPDTLLGVNPELVTVRFEAGHALGGIVYQAGEIVETPKTPEVVAQLEAGLLKEIT